MIGREKQARCSPRGPFLAPACRSAEAKGRQSPQLPRSAARAFILHTGQVNGCDSGLRSAPALSRQSRSLKIRRPRSCPGSSVDDYLPSLDLRNHGRKRRAWARSAVSHLWLSSSAFVAEEAASILCGGRPARVLRAEAPPHRPSPARRPGSLPGPGPGPGFPDEQITPSSPSCCGMTFRHQRDSPSLSHQYHLCQGFKNLISTSKAK